MSAFLETCASAHLVLEIAFAQEVSMRACVCVSPPQAIKSHSYEMNPE